MDLTEQEQRFLAEQRLSASDVLDGRGLSPAARKRMAKEQGKTLILGVPCKKGGHRLRTHAGHCTQCDPRRIAYEARHAETGYVYIARSRQKDLIKVGVTKSIGARERSLRDQGYAGARDWEICRSEKCAESGRIEGDTQRLLAKHKVKSECYLKDGEYQEAYEVFRCAFILAESALDQAIKNNSSIDEK